MKTKTAQKILAALIVAIISGAVVDLLIDIEFSKIAALVICVVGGTIYGIAAHTLISDAEKGGRHE